LADGHSAFASERLRTGVNEIKTETRSRWPAWPTMPGRTAQARSRRWPRRSATPGWRKGTSGSLSPAGTPRRGLSWSRGSGARWLPVVAPVASSGRSEAAWVYRDQRRLACRAPAGLTVPGTGPGRLDAEHIRLAVLRIPAKVHRGLLGRCRFSSQMGGAAGGNSSLIVAG
jgi:hypothetical protein